MVAKFLKLFHKEISGLHEAAFLLGAFAILSQVLALVRDRLLAHNFGAGADLDVYYAAFRIPDLIFVSLGSFVASTVLIPFLVSKLDDRAEAHRFFDTIFTAFFAAMVVVSAVVFAFMPQLAHLVAPGFTDVARDHLVMLSRIMLLSPFLLGISSLFACITQSLNKFFVYAMSPILYNAGIIIGILFFYPVFGLAGLAYGVVLGAVMHACIQIPVLLAEGFVPRPRSRILFADVRQVVLLSLPRTMAFTAQTIALAALVAMASYMKVGSIAVFNFAFNLQSVPLSIIGVSYSVAAFPTLAKLFSRGERDAFITNVSNASRHIIFWSLPVLTLFIVLRAQIVRTILGSGHFGWADTRLTAAALGLFALSITAQSLILLFVRAYYAAGETRKPVLVNVSVSVCIVLAAFILMRATAERPHIKELLAGVMHVRGVGGGEMLILPFVFSLGMIVNATILWFLFRRDFKTFASTSLTRACLDSVVASLAVGMTSYESLAVFDHVFSLTTFLGIFLQGLCAGIFGIGVGLLVLRLLRNRETSEIATALKKKFWKSSPVAPDQGAL